MYKMCEKDLICRPSLDVKQHFYIHSLCALIGSGGKPRLETYNDNVKIH